MQRYKLFLDFSDDSVFFFVINHQKWVNNIVLCNKKDKIGMMFGNNLVILQYETIRTAYR